MTKSTVADALSLGIRAHKSGDLRLADRYYTSILKVIPNHGDANHNLGILAASLGENELAETLMRKATAAHPNVVDYWISLINLNLQNNKTTAAVDFIKEAHKYHSNTKQFSLFNENLQTYLITNYLETKNIDIEKSQIKLSIGALIDAYNDAQYLTVLKSFQTAQKETGKKALLYNLIGASFYQLNMINLAECFYTYALLELPNDASTLNNLGNVLYKRGNLQQAIRLFKEAIDQAPQFSHYHFNLANTYKKLGHLGLAEAGYIEAIQLAPEQSTAYFALAETLRLSKQLEKSKEYYLMGLEIDPKNSNAWNDFGILNNEMSDYESAINCYEQALHFNSGPVENFDTTIIGNDQSLETLNNLANVHKKMGNVQLASEYYKKGISVAGPNDDTSEKFDIISANYFDLIIQTLPTSRSRITERFIENFIARADRNWKHCALRSIFHYVNGEFGEASESIARFNTFEPQTINRFSLKEQKFCYAFTNFITKLLNEHTSLESGISDRIYHLGESHCLSFAHQVLQISGRPHLINSLITFGAKAYHFTGELSNQYKQITHANFASIPEPSVVFVSFGEIDCRWDEGIISAARKLHVSVEVLIQSTVQQYIDYFFKLNSVHNHELVFLTVPAPIYNAQLTDLENNEVAYVVSKYNSTLAEECIKKHFHLFDTYKLTNADGFSNLKYHIDDRHLGPSILQEFSVDDTQS